MTEDQEIALSVAIGLLKKNGYPTMANDLFELRRASHAGDKRRVNAMIHAVECECNGYGISRDTAERILVHVDEACAAPTPSTPAPVAWEDAYAAFKGAFDTPQIRMKMNDEYSQDARKRLREFDESFMTAPPTLPDADQHLANLLARIHHDGGQYQAEFGALKAVEMADKIVANLYAHIDAALSSDLEFTPRAPVAWYDPSNKNPAQSVTFDPQVRAKGNAALASTPAPQRKEPT